MIVMTMMMSMLLMIMARHCDQYYHVVSPWLAELELCPWIGPGH